MDHSDIVVLIPAYKPEGRLNGLIRDLKWVGFRRIVVVNDGSDEMFAPYFEEAIAEGAHVIVHEKNLGKGAALKTGLRYIYAESRAPVITADADGQHTPEDIWKIAKAIIDYPNSLILGVRNSDEMPLRSKMGNTLTAFLFGMLTGHFISDTQTGLRGLPTFALKGFAALAGNRYEYEMNMLLASRHQNVTIHTIPIDTVYFANNKGSHFRSVRDGARVYYLMFRQVLAFMGSSPIAAAIDLLTYTILQSFFPHLVFLAVAVARAFSGTANFIVNREVLLREQRDARAVLRYALLVTFMLCASYGMITLFLKMGIPFFPSKLLADGILFFLNCHIQQSFIFRRRM